MSRGGRSSPARRVSASRFVTSRARCWPTCDIIEATDHGVKVGFATERLARLAALHESGTKHMPARPFLGLSRAMVDRVVRFLKARMGK